MNCKKRKKKKNVSQYQKLRIHKKKNMGNLHFLPNNILIWFSKELKKINKNDYISIVIKLYKQELYYAS